MKKMFFGFVFFVLVFATKNCNASDTITIDPFLNFDREELLFGSIKEYKNAFENNIESKKNLIARKKPLVPDQEKHKKLMLSKLLTIKDEEINFLSRETEEQSKKSLLDRSLKYKLQYQLKEKSIKFQKNKKQKIRFCNVRKKTDRILDNKNRNQSVSRVKKKKRC